MRKEQIHNLSILFAVIGLIISIYLTIVHYNTSVILACPDKGVINCENVLTSQYSMLFGVVPVAVLGIVFFIAELIVILAIKNNDYFIILSGIGIAFVIYYIYSEYAVGSICIYCTAVHICTVALFALSILNSKNA